MRAVSRARDSNGYVECDADAACDVDPEQAFGRRRTDARPRSAYAAIDPPRQLHSLTSMAGFRRDDSSITTWLSSGLRPTPLRRIIDPCSPSVPCQRISTLDDDTRWRKRLDLIGDATRRLGTDAVDVVVLEQAPSVLGPSNSLRRPAPRRDRSSPPRASGRAGDEALLGRGVSSDRTGCGSHASYS